MEKAHSDFSLNEVEFFADFFMVPVFIMVMMHYNTDDLVPMILGLLIGMGSWTLYEYLLHRYLFHQHPWFREGHENHHRLPKAFIGHKPWVTAVTTAALWTTIFLIFGKNNASAYTSGMLLGYLIYSGVHLNLHHGDPSTFHKPLARLYRHHAAHHRGGTKNFGVSVTWWDKIFGTSAEH